MLGRWGPVGPPTSARLHEVKRRLGPKMCCWAPPQLFPFHGTSQRSIKRMAKENAKAQAAMMPMPTKTKSVARNCDADVMKWPMPRVAGIRIPDPEPVGSGSGDTLLGSGDPGDPVTLY